jgi:hypothetical protein
MNETVKKYAVSGSAIILAIAMGLQTFLFGNSDIKTLKEEVATLSDRIAVLEVPVTRE